MVLGCYVWYASRVLQYHQELDWSWVVVDNRRVKSRLMEKVKVYGMRRSALRCVCDMAGFTLLDGNVQLDGEG